MAATRKRIVRRLKGNETPGLAGASREPQASIGESDSDSDEYVPRDDSFSESEPLDLPSTPQFLNRHRRRRPSASSDREEDIWNDTSKKEEDEVTFPRQKAAELLLEHAFDGQTAAAVTATSKDLPSMNRPQCGQDEDVRNDAGKETEAEVSFPRQKAAGALQERDLLGQTEASVTALRQGNRLVQVEVLDDSAVMHLRDIRGREPVRRPRRQQLQSCREHPALLARRCKRGK